MKYVLMINKTINLLHKCVFIDFFSKWHIIMSVENMAQTRKHSLVTLRLETWPMLKWRTSVTISSHVQMHYIPLHNSTLYCIVFSYNRTDNQI